MPLHLICALILVLPSMFGCGDGSGTSDGTDTGDSTGTSDSTDDGDTGSLSPDFVDQLTEAGGCGDVFIHLTNPDGTIGLSFSGAPLCQIAHDMEAQQMRVSELPSADVDLRLQLGTKLDVACHDEDDELEVTTEWTAVSGTVTLTVVPVGMDSDFESPATATLELTDVTFEGDGLEPVVISSLIISDVSVGWLAG